MVPNAKNVVDTITKDRINNAIDVNFKLISVYSIIQKFKNINFSFIIFKGPSTTYYSGINTCTSCSRAMNGCYTC